MNVNNFLEVFISMQKNENDILGALLGAAIMGGLADQAKKPEPEPKPNEDMERAKMLRSQYEAFIEVGFTEEQATQFVAAILA